MTKNTVTLVQGGNTPIAKDSTHDIVIEWRSSPADLDVSCFLVQADGNVPSDDYMIFYNQPTDPTRMITLHDKAPTTKTFSLSLPSLQPSNIQKCVFALTLDGPGTLKEVQDLKITVKSATDEILFNIHQLSEETSLVLAEIYRYKDWFKFRGIGQGFNGGLKPLAEAHGVVVEDETNTSEQIPSAQLESPAAPPSNVNMTKIDLLKKKVAVSLEKHKLTKEKARVAVVIDASGSMSMLYSKGTVQRAFEKVLAIAACMDDDGALDVWFFGDKFMRAPSVRESDYEDYVKRIYPKPRLFGGVGAGNNEPRVMADVIQKFTVEEPTKDLPTYIIFFSDGGIYEEKKISSLLVESSKENIFWQFVGIGNAKYGVLERLDNLTGRVVDNADFFALDDLDKIGDDELYNRLFNEFPQWLREARRLGITN
ncbi:vWA domain-containing protein [Ureibacillus aquaedulcis]|uniref:VWA domain-containing protein n=1 Tax=Ureibacillus aquaedulcis TaxID=3058421 RepID=A0ABT8GSP5_9BACL|nr:VWA domain-containing protein [Ureibacillus sp. BA0131]MDN4494424.1 VWA domain-containing protein [Ureibacillus sp. BA0131]